MRTAPVNDVPTFLVEWSSRWQEFRTAIKPALSRSPQKLAAEAPTGLFPLRGLLLSCFIELAVLIVTVLLPAKLTRIRTEERQPKPNYSVIYYSGEELPQTEDSGGTRAGHSGRPGGEHAHHPTQAIRVARGEKPQEKIVDAPIVNLPRSNSAVANLLAYRAVLGPAPTQGLQSSTRHMEMPTRVIAPTPEILRESLTGLHMRNSAVVAPAPSTPHPSVALLHLPGNTPPVIAPAVSAPERVTSLPPQLTLPVPSVIAPAPQFSPEVARSGPGFAPELSKQVIPPPAQLESEAAKQRTVPGLGGGPVVPPSAQLEEAAGRHPMVGLGSLPAVIAPSPTISDASSRSGLKSGNRGLAFGNPAGAEALAPPASPKSAGESGTGVVVSSQPGPKAGMPSRSAGAIALSPAGGAKPGVGETGGGSGIGKGPAAGSGSTSGDRGGGETGEGLGWDTISRNGISPHPGPGGAGNGTTGKPPLPGVSVSGGSKIVTLPSFGGDPKPGTLGRSTTNRNQPGPGITVVATSRSGGAFNFYGTLKGDKVYTIYIDTTLGTAVMQFADPSSTTHPYAEDLTSPQPMRAELPANMQRSRLIIACVLDREGTLKDAKVLHSGAAEVTHQVMAALPSWKFRPALRGNQPVEVNAIVGFGIDTR
jgi:hypothetical protein